MHCTCVRQSDLPNTTSLFKDVLYHPDKTALFYQHPLRNLAAFQAAARQIEFSGERRAALIDALRVQNPRSEERRVGKECRSRGSPYHSKKTSFQKGLVRVSSCLPGRRGKTAIQRRALNLFLMYEPSFYKQKTAYEMPK